MLIRQSSEMKPLVKLFEPECSFSWEATFRGKFRGIVPRATSGRTLIFPLNESVSNLIKIQFEKIHMRIRIQKNIKFSDILTFGAHLFIKVHRVISWIQGSRSILYWKVPFLRSVLFFWRDDTSVISKYDGLLTSLRRLSTIKV